MNIVAATTVSSPYIAARYQRFQELNPQYPLTLLEFGHVSADYAWKPLDADVPYRRKVLSEKPIQKYRSAERVSMICSALDELQPDVLVVCGYGVIGMAAVLYWACMAGRSVAVVMLSDSTAEDQQRTWWKEKIKQRVVGLCGSALVAGTRHRNYLRQLGMPDNRIFTGYDVVDNEYFWSGAKRIRAEASLWREKLGLPDYYFLSSARFIRSDSGIDRVKNIHRLLDAFATFHRCSSRKEWGLVILGGGELQIEIEAQIADLGLTGKVLLPGFRQYPELPAYYGLASVFVHASVKDTWGLVVNEAMASGLPVLVSERSGCAPDLVENGRNGYTFDPYDVDALAGLMLKLSSPEYDRAAMGRASLEIISRWTPDTFSQGLAEAVKVALASPRQYPGWTDKALLWALGHR